MNASIKNLNQVLAFQLEGLYEIVKTLQNDMHRLSKLVDDREMRMVFTEYHRNLGDERLKLKRIFGYLLNEPYRHKASEVSTILQWNDIAETDILPPLRDVLLSNSLGLLIQYQIVGYTEARYIAMRLELDTVVRLLDEMIDSQEEFAKSIKRLSSIQVNQACLISAN